MPKILLMATLETLPDVRMTVFDDGMVRYQRGDELLGELALDVDRTNDTPDDLLILSIDRPLEQSMPPRISLPVPVGGE